MRNTILLIAIGVVTTLAGCYPKGGDNTTDFDLAASVYDPAVDFDDYRTYIIPDTVAVISEDEDEMIPEAREQLILDEIKRNLTFLGWVEETDPANNQPDVVITASAWKLTNTVIYEWWSYWGWYPGWGYWPGWGGGCCYYPWYPWGGTTVYQYTTGTVLIDMFDPSELDAVDEQFPTMWLGAVNGLAEGSNAAINQRLVDGIEQVFEQSPYLNIN